MKIALSNVWSCTENQKESARINNLVNLRQHPNVSHFYSLGQNTKTMENKDSHDKKINSK